MPCARLTQFRWLTILMSSGVWLDHEGRHTMTIGIAFLIGALVGSVGTGAILTYWFVIRPMN
jgi:hypothetical protein